MFCEQATGAVRKVEGIEIGRTGCLNSLITHKVSCRMVT